MNVTGTIYLRGIGKSLTMSRLSKIKLNDSGKEFIYLDKLSDGTWRFCYTEATIPNILDLEGFIIISDDKKPQQKGKANA